MAALSGCRVSISGVSRVGVFIKRLHRHLAGPSPPPAWSLESHFAEVEITQMRRKSEADKLEAAFKQSFHSSELPTSSPTFTPLLLAAEDLYFIRSVEEAD